MELERIEARLLSDPRHLRWRGIDEHPDREQASFGRGFSSGGYACAGRRRVDLPPCRGKNESNEIRPCSSGNRRMLWIAQSADFDDTPASEEPSQLFPGRT
jgi:hypothetical protein